MRISWSSRALKSYYRIIEYLFENWTTKEIDQFYKQTKKTIGLIKQNPYMFQATEVRKNVRKGFVNKLVSIYYRINIEKKEIELLVFWQKLTKSRQFKFVKQNI